MHLCQTYFRLDSFAVRTFEVSRLIQNHDQTLLAESMATKQQPWISLLRIVQSITDPALETIRIMNYFLHRILIMEDIREEAEQQQIIKAQSAISKPKIVDIRVQNKPLYFYFLKQEYVQCKALIQPNNQFHLYINGCIQKRIINIQKALDIFKQCHVMDKLNFQYLKNIAKSMYLLGRFKSVIEVVNEAVRIRKDWEIMHLLGKTYQALGDGEAAIKYYEGSLIIDLNEQSYIELAKLYMSKKRYDKCMSTLKEASAFSSENAEIFSSMGKLSLALNKSSDAKQNFESALELQRAHYESLLGLGSILQGNGQIDEAIMKYKLAYSKEPNSAILWNNIGMCFFQKNKLIAAYSCLKKAIYLDAFQWNIYMNLALVCMEMKKYVTAFVNLSMAISLKPEDSNLFMLLGITLTNLNDFNNAELAYQSALKIQTKGNIQINYAIMLAKKKDFKKSKQYAALAAAANDVDRDRLQKLQKILSRK